MNRQSRTRSLSPLVLALFLALSCAAPTDQAAPGLNAAKGAGGPPGSPTVTGAEPSEAEQGTTLAVTVSGSGYDQGSTVDLLLSGKASPKVRTNSTTFVSENQVVANVSIDIDATIAAYDVRVTTSGGKKGIGIESFVVKATSSPPGQWDPPILDVKFREGSGGTDAVRGDDEANSPYLGLAHISGNGNLQFWLGSESPRFVSVLTSLGAGQTRDRVYTNNHTNPGGDDAAGLLGIVHGGSGTAVFEVELNISDNDPAEILRYGKDCTGRGAGDGNVVEATKVETTRSVDGRTWTIKGVSGVHCKQVTKKPGLSQVGTAGPFSMTLVWPQ